MELSPGDEHRRFLFYGGRVARDRSSGGCKFRSHYSQQLGVEVQVFVIPLSVLATPEQPNTSCSRESRARGVKLRRHRHIIVVAVDPHCSSMGEMQVSMKARACFQKPSEV